MLGNRPFYNRTIRKVVVAFGTLFNEIRIRRFNKAGTVAFETFKVPLSYGTKEKYLTRITSDPNLTKSIQTIVPRISFELTGMTYDTSRKLPSMLRNYSANTSTSVNAQYAPVPYDFEFSLSIYVRNTEDGTQILEQILPFFTPDFTVTVDFIPSMNQKYDFPIILNSVNTTTDYEGDMMTTRLIIWDLTFTAKGYIWPPVKPDGPGDAPDYPIIRRANTNIFLETQRRDGQKVTVDFANGNGVFLSGETIRSIEKGITGSVLYFSNTSSGVLVVDGLNRLLEPNDIVTGDFSNATYTVVSTETEAYKATAIVTEPNPITAEIDDEFGFSETFTRYPDTLL
jgi:hypothetical protein